MDVRTLTTRTLPAAALAGVLALAPAPDTAAQEAPRELRYSTVSEVEFGGTLGRMMRAWPGDQNEVRETVWISGPRTRTDTEHSSTIMDLEARRYTVLDHETKTYWTVDLSDWEVAMRQMAASMAEGAEEARAEDAQRRAEAGDEEAIRRLEIDLSTERTGDRREISGYDTERVFVTLEMKAEYIDAAADSAHPEMQEGTVVILNEMWLTDEPLLALPEDLDIEGYREMSADAMDDWAALEQAYANDPEMRVAFDRSRAALEDLEGTAVESTIFWVSVPPDKEFDLQKALDDRDRSLFDDVAAAAAESAKESAKDAAENAVKSRLGGLGGGLFGGDDDEEEEIELVQYTFMRIKTRLEEMERGGVPASIFEIPEGYTERVIEPMEGAGDPGGH